MIDFRYHVVSLISVFLALAVGIALGAGPLKETIGDSLTGQVQQLRTEKDALRAELDGTSADLKNQQAYIDAAGPRLLDDTLTDRRVAVIALGEVPEETRTAIDARLDQAGATVSAHVTVNSAWTNPDLRSYRQALAGQLVSYLSPTPPQSAGLDVELAYALVQSLVSADPTNPDALSQDAGSLLDVLSNGDDPLVSVAQPVQQPADAVVLLAPPLEEVPRGSTPSPTPSPAITTSLLAIVAATQDQSEGATLADGPRGAGSLVDAVLADDALAAKIATVSATQDVSGQVSVPLALAARIGGTAGHYGFGAGETPIPNPKPLPPVDRTPQSPEGADAPATP